jgi:capsular exopolysaccharide synthesis family protein
MERKRPSRFSLGDIIRRMNDQADGDEEQTTGPEQSEPRPSRPAPPPPRRLPRQPSFSRIHAAGGSQPEHAAEESNGDSAAQREQPSSAAPTITVAEPVSTTPQAAPTPPPLEFDSDDEEDFDLFRYLGVIIRRRNIIIVAVILAGLFSAWSYMKAPRFYTARARLLFRPEQMTLTNDRSFVYWRSRDKDFNTHLELLKSSIVLERVADNLGNRVSSGGIGGGLGIRQGETNGEKNDIIELSYRNLEAETARDVLNELCKTYIQYRREVNTQEETQFLMKLQAQINKLEAELNARESDLREFKENNRLVKLSEKTDLLVSKLADMERALQQTQLQLLESKERMSGLRAQIGQQETNIVQSMTYENPYQDRIGQLQLQLSTLSAEYSPDHYKIQTITQQIEQLKKAMETEITQKAVSQTMVKNPIRESLLQQLVNQSIEMAALEAKRTAQEQLIDKLGQDIQRLPRLEQRYAFLQRQTESLLQTLSMMKRRYEEARIQRDSQETDIKILELAALPGRAVSSKKASSVFVGLLVGLVIGIALAFLLEYLDQTLKEPSDVEKGLELPLIGLVPIIDASKAMEKDNSHLTKTILEPFRALRANLKHLAATHRAKVIMLCSAVKGEGKTTLAVNLATTFAMDDKKVILIDADLRRSQVHQLLNTPKECGLSDYLIGEKELLDIIKPTHHHNLFVITSGERPHNPAELLGTPRFDQLLQELRSQGDIIIFDSPALLPVSDTITMAPKMDAVVMVTRALWTPIKAARQAKHQLGRIGTRFLGGIFNGISQSRGYYPYYYGYYGYYAYRYSYDEEPRKFSMRQLGVDIERNLREGIENARLAVPRAVGRSSRLVRRVVRRKTFWILLIVLAGLTSARIYLSLRLPQSSREWISRVGAGSSLQSEPIAPPGPAMEVIQNPTDGATAGDSSTTEVSPPPEGAERFAAQSPAETLEQVLDTWVEAQRGGDVDVYLSLYDREDFVFPDGEYARWAEHTREQWLSTNSRDSIIINVDSSWVEKLKENHLKAHIQLTTDSEDESRSVLHVMIWRRGPDGWRIVRHKQQTQRSQQR